MRVFAVLLCLLLGGELRADQALQIFTSQANAGLQAQFGFGVTNIPIYSPTNANVRYSAALHYVLQAAANAYDETMPAPDYPSVFRPQFGWQGGDLFIVGYTNVTTDFAAQFAVGFKDITDTSIGVNDNVWGVPWVVGMKDNAPQFNGFQSVNVMTMTRKLLVTRLGPPHTSSFRTNQIYLLSASNVMGLEAWNNEGTLANPVEVVISNWAEVILTNNYDWGTNFASYTGTNLVVNSWPSSFNPPRGFVTFQKNVKIAEGAFNFPLQWFESKAELLPLSAPGPEWNTNVPGLPVHDWEVRVTNHVVYALLDGSSGTNRLLDFVNVGPLGGSLNWNRDIPPFVPISPGDAPPSYSLVWQTNGASDLLDSPPSLGVRRQIDIGAGLISVSDWPGPSGIAGPSNQDEAMFLEFLNGGNIGTNVMDPFQPTTMLAHLNEWPTVNPKVHYTVEDLSGWTNSPIVIFDPTAMAWGPLTGILGSRSPDYRAARPMGVSYGVTSNEFEVSFAGVPDLPYMVWGSTNLVDWSDLGAATQTGPGIFRFVDGSNAVSRFYRVITP